VISIAAEKAAEKGSELFVGSWKIVLTHLFVLFCVIPVRCGKLSTMPDAMPPADVTAKLPRRFRRMRIALSVFFGVVCVALIVLCVISYRWIVVIAHTGIRSYTVYNEHLILVNGAVRFNVSTIRPGDTFPVVEPWIVRVQPTENKRFLPAERGEPWEARTTRNGFRSSVPLWFLALTSASLSVVLLLPFSRRLGFCRSLISTTLASVAYGGIIAGRRVAASIRAVSWEVSPMDKKKPQIISLLFAFVVGAVLGVVGTWISTRGYPNKPDKPDKRDISHIPSIDLVRTQLGVSRQQLLDSLSTVFAIKTIENQPGYFHVKLGGSNVVVVIYGDAAAPIEANVSSVYTKGAAPVIAMAASLLARPIFMDSDWYGPWAGTAINKCEPGFDISAAQLGHLGRVDVRMTKYTLRGEPRLTIKFRGDN
jgi:hypothetical protein